MKKHIINIILRTVLILAIIATVAVAMYIKIHIYPAVVIATLAVAIAGCYINIDCILTSISMIRLNRFLTRKRI